MLKKGFTLIELLIVIAIIAILAGVVFVSLDPGKRFAAARDAARWTDVTAVLSAIKVNQVDLGGAYLDGPAGQSIADLTADIKYMIGTATSGCNDASCSAVTADANCVDLSSLSSGGYLANIPVSPNATGDSWGDDLTGYYMSRNTNGSITVAACHYEGTEAITVNR